MLPIQKQLIDCNYTKGVIIQPKYIVIHDTDNKNKGANAQANRNYFANHPNAQASTHYLVDESNIIQALEDNWRGWHVGDSYLGTKPKRPEINNSNSIGIEICVNSDGNFNKAWYNACDLTAYLMKRHGIGIENLAMHNHVTGKKCSRMIIENNWWDAFLRDTKISLEKANKGDDNLPKRVYIQTKVLNTDGDDGVHASAFSDKFLGKTFYTKACGSGIIYESQYISWEEAKKIEENLGEDFLHFCFRYESDL